MLYIFFGFAVVLSGIAAIVGSGSRTSSVVVWGGAAVFHSSSSIIVFSFVFVVSIEPWLPS
jgi:hypothetical protein